MRWQLGAEAEQVKIQVDGAGSDEVDFSKIGVDEALKILKVIGIAGVVVACLLTTCLILYSTAYCARLS
jgi:hypothetical protein